MYFFIKLQFVCFLTLLLLIAELVLDHFTHSITLLVVAWQTLYNFISLFISSVSLALSHNNSKELAIKVILTKLITNSWCYIINQPLIFKNYIHTYNLGFNFSLLYTRMMSVKIQNFIMLRFVCWLRHFWSHLRVPLDGNELVSLEQCSV